MVGSFDIVADGSDNFATRYAVSDACYYEKRPLVTAAVGAFDGALTVLRPYENGPFGEPNPASSLAPAFSIRSATAFSGFRDWPPCP
jgi:adenylyltransferase/sulfurtransferase